MHHVAADGVAVAEQAPGVFEVAGSQRLAHRGAGDADAALRDRAHLLDLEAELRARRLQVGEIAGTLGAEAEVVADQQPARVQPVDQHIAHELLRRLRGEMRIEVLDNHPVDALAAQALQLVAQQRDAGGRAVRHEEFARMRLEGHDRQRQSARVGRRARAGQQGLVAAVHAVEVADGQRAGRAALGIGQAAKDFHVERRGSKKKRVFLLPDTRGRPQKTGKTHII